MSSAEAPGNLDPGHLAPGDVAPAFTLPDPDGTDRSLSDYPGQRVVVYFYPAALTPGCTTQAIDFTEAEQDFTDAGIAVIGISPDPVDKLSRFREKESVGITLLSDESKQTLNAYRAYGAKMMYGKSIEGVIRSTFVIDVAADGVGTVAEAQYNVRAKGHVAKLKRDLSL